MACNTCGVYDGGHCDLFKMVEELRIKKMEVELLELKIEKERKKRKDVITLDRYQANTLKIIG